MRNYYPNIRIIFLMSPWIIRVNFCFPCVLRWANQTPGAAAFGLRCRPMAASRKRKRVAFQMSASKKVTFFALTSTHVKRNVFAFSCSYGTAPLVTLYRIRREPGEIEGPDPRIGRSKKARKRVQVLSISCRVTSYAKFQSRKNTGR